MKKILIALVAFVTVNTSDAQVFMVSGKKAEFTAPKGITANNQYLFPTFKAENTVYADDTTSLTVKNLETYVTIDSISQTSWLLLTNASYLLPGAKIYLHAESDGTGAYLLYIKKGSAVVDTVLVGDAKTDRSYVWNGSTWKRIDNQFFPNYVYNVTQQTNITTGVTANADAGVITTVSATLDDTASASFTLTNSFIKAESVIQLTTGTSGNGLPVAFIVSQTAGSAVIKLRNVGPAALNAAVKIHFAVLNK